MRRRLGSLLLTALVALTGVAVGACPLGRCLAMQPVATEAAPTGADHAGHGADARHAGHARHHAHGGTHHADATHAGAHHEAHAGTHHVVADVSAEASHACCDRDGIANPPCCPETGQLAPQRATPSSDRTGHAIQLVATVPVAAGLATFVRTAVEPPRPVPLGAPPGTLVTQHTSLLV